MNFEQELQILLQKYPDIESVSYKVMAVKTVSRIPHLMMGMVNDVPPPRVEGEVAPGLMADTLPENPQDKINALMKRAKIIDMTRS